MRDNKSFLRSVPQDSPAGRNLDAAIVVHMFVAERWEGCGTIAASPSRALNPCPNPCLSTPRSRCQNPIFLYVTFMAVSTAPKMVLFHVRSVSSTPAAPLTPTAWFLAVDLLIHPTYVIPVFALEQRLVVSYPTAPSIGHKDRQVMPERDAERQPTGVIWIDERFLRGECDGEHPGPHRPTRPPRRREGRERAVNHERDRSAPRGVGRGVPRDRAGAMGPELIQTAGDGLAKFRGSGARHHAAADVDRQSSRNRALTR